MQCVNILKPTNCFGFLSDNVLCRTTNMEAHCTRTWHLGHISYSGEIKRIIWYWGNKCHGCSETCRVRHVWRGGQLCRCSSTQKKRWEIQYSIGFWCLGHRFLVLVLKYLLSCTFSVFPALTHLLQLRKGC